MLKSPMFFQAFFLLILIAALATAVLHAKHRRPLSRFGIDNNTESYLVNHYGFAPVLSNLSRTTSLSGLHHGIRVTIDTFGGTHGRNTTYYLRIKADLANRPNLQLMSQPEDQNPFQPQYRLSRWKTFDKRFDEKYQLFMHPSRDIDIVLHSALKHALLKIDCPINIIGSSVVWHGKAGTISTLEKAIKACVHITQAAEPDTAPPHSGLSV